MTEAGVGPETYREALVCRMPTPVEEADLGLPRGTPVVAITRYAYTNTRRCVEVNFMVLDASAYELEYLLGA
jgi:GntR family transcriptional regulator